MTTYKPVISEDNKHVVVFTKKELAKLLYKLEKSKAQEIGVEIQVKEK